MIADFWFDPSCPYTWLTSQWLREVATIRPVTVRWHLMSLSVLNEGRDDDPEDDPEGYLWYPVRICAAVERSHGPDTLGRFYEALGQRFYDGDWAAIPDVLTELGLPASLAEAATATEHDDAVRASHAEAMELVGDDVGSPVLAVSGAGPRFAFFGPVVSPVPLGEDAGRLWDGILLVGGTPGFYELKRTRTADSLVP